MSEFAQWYQEKSGELLQSINTRTNSEIQKFIEEIENMERFDISFLQVGYGFAPEPITPESYIARGPYGKPEMYQQEMDGAVERGWLDQVGEGQYTLSEKGKELVERFFTMGNTQFAELPTLSDSETERLVELLQKLVNKADTLPEGFQKPTFIIGKKLEPSTDAPLMLRLRRYLVDMAYFREDVHIAAWQPYSVNGQVWETLTLVWREEAGTATELAEQLSEYRNYDEASYAAVLKDLTSMGWITQENGKYVASDEGKRIRQEGEDRTDEYYGAPFEVFSDSEKDELKSLMEKMAEVLKPPEEEEETSGE